MTLSAVYQGLLEHLVLLCCERRPLGGDPGGQGLQLLLLLWRERRMSLRRAKGSQFSAFGPGTCTCMQLCNSPFHMQGVAMSLVRPRQQLNAGRSASSLLLKQCALGESRVGVREEATQSAYLKSAGARAASGAASSIRRPYEGRPQVRGVLQLGAHLCVGCFPGLTEKMVGHVCNTSRCQADVFIVVRLGQRCTSSQGKCTEAIVTLQRCLCTWSHLQHGADHGTQLSRGCCSVVLPQVLAPGLLRDKH